MRLFSSLILFSFLSSSALAWAAPKSLCTSTREEKVLALVQENSLEFIEAGKLKEIYSDTVVFQDPIKTVNGYENAAEYLSETFKLLDFKAKATKIVKQGDTYVAFWTAETQLKAGPIPVGQPFVYEGLSVLTFDRSQKIISHRDYFDQFALYRIIPGFEQKASQLLNEFIISQLPAMPAQ
jgi:ketosteroid isomerase-like protein